MYVYQLFGLSNDIITTLNGWLALDNYIYSAYYVLEIVQALHQSLQSSQQSYEKVSLLQWYYL